MANTGNFKDVIALSDGANAKFAKAVQTSEKKILSEVIVMLMELEITKSGNIATTPANLKKMMNIRTKLYKLANNKEYLAAVKDLISTFDEIYKKQIGVLALKDKIGRGEEKYKLTKEIAVENTVTALSGDGLAANVTNKLNEMLLTAVTTGAKFSDLQGQLYEYLADTEKSQGALTRYATTWSVTVLSQYTGQINKLATDDLGYEWFEYVGSNIETTREFCQHVTRKRYVHKSELEDLLKGHIVDYMHGEEHDCAIYAKTELPYGMIEGTTVENLQVNCGGWNCRHQLFPIAEEAVPQVVRDAIKQKYGPTADQQALIDRAKELLALQPKYPCMYKEDFEDLKAALNADPMDYNELDYNCQFVEGAMKTHQEDYAKAEAKAKDAISYNDNIKAQYGVSADDSDLVAEMNNGIYDWKTLEKKAAELMKAANAVMWDYAGKVSDAEKLIDKYGATKAAGGVKKEDIKGASVQELDALIKKLQDVGTMLGKYKNIPGLDDAAKELDEADLVTLSDMIETAEEIYNNTTDLDDKEKALNDSLVYAEGDAKFGKYLKEWVLNKKAELANEKIVQGVNKSLKDIEAYTDAHPKSGKVKNLLDEAYSAMLDGDYDKANAKAQEALKVIDINEGSKKSKAAKAAAKKAAKATAAAQPQGAQKVGGFKNLDVTEDDLSLHTMEELQSVDAAVQAKIDSWSSLPLSVQKKKLEFEITWVEQNKKYSTWKIAQDAYKKKLKDVLYEIDIEVFAQKYKFLASQYANNPKVVQMLKDLEGGINAKLPAADLKKIVDKIDKQIQKEKQEELDKAKAKEEAELKKIAASLKNSSLNKPMSDDRFWEASKNTLKNEACISPLTDDQKDAVFKDLKSAIRVKDRAKATECLMKLGFDADDVYSSWRRDAATWVTTGTAGAKKEYKPHADEVFASATKDEIKAQYDYTVGSGFMNRPLRGYDGGWGWNNYRGPGNVSLNNEKSTGEKEINDLTSLINKSVYNHDVWLQRGIEPSRYPARPIESLESFLGLRDQLSEGSVRTKEDDMKVMGCVGKIVKDFAFSSHGSAKGTGFSGHIVNAYCPAGTKMLYVEGRSAYNGENEMILQRGTSFIITKVEKKGSSFYYIDCMVVAQAY